MSFRWEPFGRGETPAPSPPRDLLDGRTGAAARALAIVTCMDARLDPVGALGLRLGDAHAIRIAGAAVSGERCCARCRSPTTGWARRPSS